jgi:hypothetical protein
MAPEERRLLAQRVARDTAALTALTPTSAVTIAQMSRLERRIRRGTRMLAALAQLDNGASRGEGG